MKMNAVILEQFGDSANFVMATQEVRPPREGEVCIHIRAASINPVDFKTRKGLLGGSPPMILGVDAAGTIDTVGPGVSEFSPADEVFAFVDPEGPASNGAYAEYVTLPAAFVGRKPAGYTFPQAAALAMVGPTAYQCIFDKANLQEGEAVFVAGGAGAVGSVAIQLARYRGASPIITTAGSEGSKAYLTDALGIPEEHILNYKGLSLEEMTRQVVKMNGGMPVRAAFDFVGGQMKRLCFDVIDFDTRVVSIVEEPDDFRMHLLSGGQSPLFARSASFHFQLLLARSRFGAPDDWPIFGRQLNILSGLADAGHVKPHRIIMLDDFSARSVKQGHDQLEDGHVNGKLILPVAK